ncbi:MAG: HdeD family acid-resistance protein [Gammaproteobacteria bacterium]|jgi:uncharacterized membrane protein HdeD (DUF308 family)|nr:HdeD family acid-resistance protein [Gammaproteobacteria bacterium]
MNETVGGSGLVEKVVDLDMKVVRDRWGWFMALGILLIVLGMIAIGGPLASGVAVSLLIGWLLVISGVAHGIHAFQSSGWRGGLVQILCGLLYLGVGVMMIRNPITGLLALTVTVLVYFVVSGIFKIILAIRVEHLPQRGWVTVSGIMSLVLAIYIGSQFPTSALWVIGMLFGIEMIFSGWSFVMIAQAARSGQKSGNATQSNEIGEPSTG